MGFSSPKATTPIPAPPPVSSTGPEAAKAAEAERKKQLQRQGYDSTLNPVRQQGTLLSDPNTVKPGNASTGRQTLLTAN